MPESRIEPGNFFPDENKAQKPGIVGKMNILRMEDLDLAGKRVLIREDLNVPVSEGRVISDARIRATLPTISHALDHGAAVMLLSHLGRPPRGNLIHNFLSSRWPSSYHCCWVFWCGLNPPGWMASKSSPVKSCSVKTSGSIRERKRMMQPWRVKWRPFATFS
jgi:hypothetical protein